MIDWLTYWEQAQETEVGIALVISGASREYVQAALYAARVESGNGSLQDVIMYLPAAPYELEIWLCNKGVELKD